MNPLEREIADTQRRIRELQRESRREEAQRRLRRRCWLTRAWDRIIDSIAC